jgi:hypothetical protein
MNKTGHTLTHVIALTFPSLTIGSLPGDYLLSSDIQAATPAAQLRKLCAHFAKPRLSRAIWQLLNTLPPLLAIWALMAWSVVDGWGYGWTLLMAIPAAGFYVRPSSSTRLRARFLLRQRSRQPHRRCRLGLITLFPFGYWKKTRRPSTTVPRATWTAARWATLKR